MPTRSMTVNGIQIQSANKYNLLSGATTGFKKIIVTKDSDGFAPPPLGAASGSIDSSQADVVASTAVWNQLTQALLKFPFLARLTYEGSNVTDLEFFQINPVLAAKQKVLAFRAIAQLAEKLASEIKVAPGPQITYEGEEPLKKRPRNGQPKAPEAAE